MKFCITESESTKSKQRNLFLRHDPHKVIANDGETLNVAFRQYTTSECQNQNTRTFAILSHSLQENCGQPGMDSTLSWPAWVLKWVKKSMDAQLTARRGAHSATAPSSASTLGRDGGVGDGGVSGETGIPPVAIVLSSHTTDHHNKNKRLDPGLQSRNKPIKRPSECNTGTSHSARG